MRDESGYTVYWMMLIAAVAAIGLTVGESVAAVDLALLIIVAASLLILISCCCVWLIDKRPGRERCIPKQDIKDEESN